MASVCAQPRLRAGSRKPALSPRGRRATGVSCRVNKTAEYNKVMAEKMKWDPDAPYKYDFERGLYYHHILQDELLCGSQPTSVADIKYLTEAENVDVIVSLQQEKDPKHWGIDVAALHHAMHDAGIAFHRTEVVDFDGGSLRAVLPRAVYQIARHIAEGRKVYVHCTAGLGRAPAACIAYLFWFREFTLDEAVTHLTTIRPCGPNRDAIRGATFDILSGGQWDEFAAQPPNAYSSLAPEDRHMLQFHVLQGSRVPS